MLSWFRNLFDIVRDYDIQITEMQSRVSALENALQTAMVRIARAEKVIRERTDIHLDVSASRRDPCTVVLIGKYKGVDYVEVVPLNERSLADVIAYVHSQHRFGNVSRIDAPYHMSAVIRADIQKGFIP